VDNDTDTGRDKRLRYCQDFRNQSDADTEALRRGIKSCHESEDEQEQDRVRQARNGCVGNFEYC
jgi:hypothetical protein